MVLQTGKECIPEEEVREKELKKRKKKFTVKVLAKAYVDLSMSLKIVKDMDPNTGRYTPTLKVPLKERNVHILSALKQKYETKQNKENH